MPSNVAGISKAPVYSTDRTPLTARLRYDFRDYGFEITPRLTALFEIIPTVLTDEECFLFFIARDDVESSRWALFNLHIFLKRKEPLESFARSLGSSVRDVTLMPETAFHQAGIGYSRAIMTGDLFKGAESVITFIGGDPFRLVRDSHFYFMHSHNHCYTGLLHSPGDEAKYDELRGLLFDLLEFQ